MDIHNLKASEVLTLDEALEAAILGYNVRAVDMGEGTFVRYDFAGFRIHHAGGSSSGWSQRPHDATVAWHVIEDERCNCAGVVEWNTVCPVHDEPAPVKKDAWGKPSGLDMQKFGRALRAVPPAPVVVKDWALDPHKEALAVPPPTAPANVGKWGKPPSLPGKWGKPT